MQTRTVGFGMGVVGKTAAAVVAAAAAPVRKTATARMMTMPPAATAVQAGNLLSPSLGDVIVSLAGLLLL